MRSGVLLLVLLSALTFGLNLGGPAITDSDEAYYAEASREMVESGDWLTPHFNYTERFQKPILYYWVTASAYRLLGVGEAQARLGSALAGLGLVLLTLGCGRRWFDAPTGWLGAAIVATSLGCVSVARMSLPDLPLAFFITLAAWAAFVALFDRDVRPRRWWALAGTAAGLAFLTKGPVGVVIPALVVLPALLLERGWRRLSPANVAVALLAFLLVGVPWYAAMTVEHGPAYLRGFFLGDNLDRFATTTFNPHRSILFYVPIVLAGMLPWSPFFFLGLKPAWRLWKTRRGPGRAAARLLSWGLVPLLLFTASVGKQPRYILPMLLPLGLGLAVLMRSAATRLPPLPAAQPGLFRWLGFASGALVILLGLLLFRVRPLLLAVPAGRPLYAAGALVAAGIVVMAVARSRRWHHVPVAVAMAGGVIVAALQLAVLADRGPEPVEQMAAHVLAQRTAGEPVAPYGVFVRNLVFYTHTEQVNLFNRERLLEYLARPDRVLCVMREGDLLALQASSFPHLRPLARITYFDAATAKPRTLLAPNPQRDLQTAVLVDNGK